MSVLSEKEFLMFEQLGLSDMAQHCNNNQMPVLRLYRLACVHCFEENIPQCDATRSLRRCMRALNASNVNRKTEDFDSLIVLD